MSPRTCSQSGFSVRDEGEHLRRQVGQGAREVLAQVGRVVAAARAELEQRPRVGQRVDDQRAVPLRLDRVVVRRRQQVEPGGEVAVEAHSRIIATGEDDDRSVTDDVRRARLAPRVRTSGVARPASVVSARDAEGGAARCHRRIRPLGERAPPRLRSGRTATIDETPASVSA